MKNLIFALLAFTLAFGCGPKDSATPGSPTGNPPATTTNPPKSADLTAPTPTLPAELNYEAVQFYGLGNSKTMGLTLTAPGAPGKTGEVTSHLEKVENGKAFYKVIRTGAIAEDLGDDSVMVDETGIYMVGTSIGDITPEKFLALPRDISPGKSWNLKTKVVRKDGQEIQENSTYKVVGMKDLKTKSGNQSALLVTSDGTALVSAGSQKQNAKYQTKSWYVKGVGPVRIEISLTAPGKPTQTLIVEQTD
jgi:hypothetical protein